MSTHDTEDDEIIAEIRRIRYAYAKRFNFDLDAIFEDLRNRERASGRKVVTLPPKRLRKYAKTA